MLTPTQIRDIRVELGLSVRDMADVLHIKYTLYGEYERGVRQMSSERVREIEEVFRSRGWAPSRE